MNTESTFGIPPEMKKYTLLCNYLVQPLVHATMTTLLWSEGIEALEKELVGATRVRPDLRILRSSEKSVRIRRTEDHYLDEGARFLQVETKRRCSPTMDPFATDARVDLYMRGALMFRYRSIVTTIDRPHDASPSLWKGKVTVCEPDSEEVRNDVRFDFDVGVFVVTHPTELDGIADKAREFRKRARRLRLAMVWGGSHTWKPEAVAEEAGLPVLTPGSLFDAFCEQNASSLPATA